MLGQKPSILELDDTETAYMHVVSPFTLVHSSYCTVCRLVDTLYCGSAVVTQLQSINIQHLGA